MERVGGDERDDHERVGDPPVDGLPVDHDHPPPPPRRRRLLLPRRGIRGHLGSSYDLESPEKKKKNNQRATGDGGRNELGIAG